MNTLQKYKRTHTCGELRGSDKDKKVRLSGWVNKRRDLGGLIFVDIRDRYGLTQVFFDPKVSENLFKLAEELKQEYVISVEGTVALRPDGMINSSMPTGEIEIHADSLNILNESAVLPFNMSELQNTDENLRMKYRYLDLRRQPMVDKMILRHKAARAIREYFDANGFLEIETPTLMSSTPEGARDYLVPSRVQPGKVYALPQSPQLFKQLLMVGGMDRYFQLAKCYRDEDLRADRQPEFTQIDLEMSFVEREDVLNMIEGMLKYLFEKALDRPITEPLPRMTWHEAMDLYGCDKPDLRYPMIIKDVSKNLKDCGFQVFDSTLSAGGHIRAITVPNAGAVSRKESDEIINMGKSFGLAGVVTLAFNEGAPKSPLTKFMSPERVTEIKNIMEAGDNDLVLFAAGEQRAISVALGKLRLWLVEKFKMQPSTDFALLWVLDFPMFSFNEEENRLEAEHHAFTSPMPEDIGLMETEPIKVRSNAYDVVLNGVELGSGSIRIHDRKLQEMIFKIMGLTSEQAVEKFGFLLKAFEFGAPPHGGIALGFDRLVSIMAEQDSIREIIAFPKNHQAICPMTNAPVTPAQEQLDMLKIKFDVKETVKA